MLEKRQGAAVTGGGTERREQLRDAVSEVAGLANDMVRTLDFTLGRGKPSEG